MQLKGLIHVLEFILAGLILFLLTEPEEFLNFLFLGTRFQ